MTTNLRPSTSHLPVLGSHSTTPAPAVLSLLPENCLAKPDMENSQEDQRLEAASCLWVEFQGLGLDLGPMLDQGLGLDLGPMLGQDQG